MKHAELRKEERRMANKLLIDAHYEDETRVAVIDENGDLLNFETEHTDRNLIKGNIYLARVERVESSLQAAFISYGAEKHGFLPFDEIQYDYYNKNVVKSAEGGDDELKNRKIQEVIHNGQVILVQAIREQRGHKCAAFSTFLSLPGRYCVLLSKTNNSKLNGGVSKKIDSVEKERLREIIELLEVPDGFSVIIRTAGESRTKQEIKRDFECLVRLWNEISGKVINSNAPLLIHEEGNIIKRTIRDLYNKDISDIVIQGESAYKDAKAFMKFFMPSHSKKISFLEDGDDPIFSKYNIEEKIRKIFDTTVSLPSGGSIIINTTEALTSIDVNSGKMKQEKNIDETAFKTNIEAAAEAARQIRLRDIAGLIVIDFIDMYDNLYIQQVERRFKECMKIDYSNIQIGRLSQFGLLEVSRQRLRQSISDINFVTCKHCGGTGKILSHEALGMSIIRQIEHFIVNTKDTAKIIVAEVADEIDLFILNNKRKLLASIEAKNDVSIEIIRDRALSFSECKIIIKEFRNAEMDAPAADLTQPRPVYGSYQRSNSVPNTQPGVIPGVQQKREVSGVQPGSIPSAPQKKDIPGPSPQQKKNAPTYGAQPGVIPSTQQKGEVSGVQPGNIPRAPQRKDIPGPSTQQKKNIPTYGVQPGVIPSAPQRKDIHGPSTQQKKNAPTYGVQPGAIPSTQQKKNAPTYGAAKKKEVSGVPSAGRAAQDDVVQDDTKQNGLAESENTIRKGIRILKASFGLLPKKKDAASVQSAKDNDRASKSENAGRVLPKPNYSPPVDSDKVESTSKGQESTSRERRYYPKSVDYGNAQPAESANNSIGGKPISTDEKPVSTREKPVSTLDQ
ncbi:MAG: Rne/Rng family ribonuclease [Holosporales bacterium]|jgi:ribonuclease E|nr:Rne/Rng family ribonuclease [Holosporales bacterium]